MDFLSTLCQDEQSVERITLPYKFETRDYQQEVFDKRDAGVKYIGLIWHRRAGKDRTCWNVTIREAFKRKGLYFYMLPLLVQGGVAIWDGMDEHGQTFLDHIPESTIAKIDQKDMSVKLSNGSIIRIVGSNYADNYRSSNPVGIVFSEYQLTDPKAFGVFSPILRQNKGWAIFNFTPLGDNHAKKLYLDTQKNLEWYWSNLNVDQTFKRDGSRVFTDHDVDLERLSGMDEFTVQQEYYNSFTASPLGSYYGEILVNLEENHRRGSFPFDPSLLVYTAWDIGLDDSTTIWFYQIRGTGKYFIDYLEDSNKEISWYYKQITAKPYNYGLHNVPHDFGNRHISYGKSCLDVILGLGENPKKWNKIEKSDKLLGIQVSRNLLIQSYFNEGPTDRGWSALKEYRRIFDRKTMKYADHPVHNWASHGADAYRMAALSMTKVEKKKPKPNMFENERSAYHSASKYKGGGSSTGWMGM